MKALFDKFGLLKGTILILLLSLACPLQAQTSSPTDDAMSPDDVTSFLEDAKHLTAQPEIFPPGSPGLAPSVNNGSFPSDIVLLLDNSGSMKANDPQFLMAKAVTEFINQMDYNTRLAVVIFDQKVTLAHPLTQVSDQSRAEMLNSLKQINYKGLRTNSPDGLERALYELKLHAREDTERFIVFLTDGIVDTGDKQKDVTKVDWMRKELAADASQNDIKIFGIAFTDGADFQLIQSLAQQTDAEYFRAYSADKIAEVFNQIQQRITSARETALQAELEASQPPPPPPAPIIVEQPKPAPAPKPIIVQVPEKPEDSQMTQYLLFGIAGLLVVVILIVLLRGRSSTPAGQAAAAAKKMPDVQLVDMRGVTDQQSYPLATEITQVGRIKGKETPGVSYIVIPEKSISRHHAVIEYRNHAFWVMDQGSGNGTRLNNQLLSEEKRLKHGDILTFDTFNFMFSEPDMEQSDATVVQATGGGGAAEEIFDMAFDEDETEMLPGGDTPAKQPPAPPPPQAAAMENTQETDIPADIDIVDDIANWDFEEESTTPPAAAVAPEPEPAPPPAAAEKPEPAKPSEQQDPVKEGLVEKDESGEFHPAKTMTPDEFDRLFAEMDKDKK